MIIVSVNRKSSTGEWLASVNIDGKFAEGPTAYTEDPEDAVNIAISTIEQYRRQGKQAELSSAQATLKQVSKYRPDWLVSEARRAAGQVASNPGARTFASEGHNVLGDIVQEGERGRKGIESVGPFALS